MYTLRRIRDKFKENKSLADANCIEDQYKEGLKSLELIKRQVSSFLIKSVNYSMIVLLNLVETQ